MVSKKLALNLPNIKKTFIQLAKTNSKNRKTALNRFPNKAYGDIKAICTDICYKKGYSPKSIKKIRRYKTIFKKISNSSRKHIKFFLISQKGKGLFSALATGVIPLLITLISKTI